MSQDLIIPFISKPQETRMSAKKRVVGEVGERPIITTGEHQSQIDEQKRLLRLQEQLEQHTSHQQKQQSEQQKSQSQQESKQAETSSASHDSDDDQGSEHIDTYI